MNAVADMNTEAARCFRRACEANDPLDRTIFNGLRQAWLVLAQQARHSAMEKPRLLLPAVEQAKKDAARVAGAPAKRRATHAKRRKAARKSAPRARRGKIAA